MTEDQNRDPEEMDQPEESTNDFNSSDAEIGNGPKFENDQSISEAYLALVPGTQKALKTLSEAGLRASQVQISIPKSTIATFTSFSENITKAYLKIFGISQVLADTLKPIHDSLSGLIKSINWEDLSKAFERLDFEGLQEGAKTWGEHGWVVSDLSPSEIRNAPESFADADKYYSQYMTKERVQKLFNNVLAEIPRKKDFEECIVLYEQKHYKSCAMMLCSLIEGQLIKHIPKITWRRNGEVALKKMQGLDNDFVDVIWVLNTISTYAYFFHNAENFNRTVEGELNRNFLMHGMMYKPVLKRTCIKLFLLLESIVVAMPDFSLQQ
ncbi:MAG: hypothetical protein ACYCDN_04965 [Schaalia turicensis]